MHIINTENQKEKTPHGSLPTHFVAVPSSHMNSPCLSCLSVLVDLYTLCITLQIPVYVLSLPHIKRWTCIHAAGMKFSSSAVWAWSGGDRS